jgi:hypothetical protein
MRLETVPCFMYRRILRILHVTFVVCTKALCWQLFRFEKFCTETAAETRYAAVIPRLRKSRTRERSVLFEQERDAVRIVQIPRSQKEDDLVEKLFAVLDRFCKALHQFDDMNQVKCFAVVSCHSNQQCFRQRRVSIKQKVLNFRV